MRDQVELTQGRRWYAVATQPGREAVARETLADDDFEVFLPLSAERTGHHRRDTRIVVRPAFGAYLFIHVDPAVTQWSRIGAARGVLGLVCAGGAPIPARPGPIEHLQRLALEGDGTIWISGYEMVGRQKCPIWAPGPLAPRKKRLPFDIGQTLRITDGILASFLGQYLGGEGDKLKLNVDMMGRAVPHTLPEAWVVAVPA